ncbi:hypothetical protein ACERK3_16540 [Phycisphaerales bacterium AB-hyl4]|uniref:Glycerophosphoryl diester phosphodiesterase membrane domain-containing protein n=1 Tax=Natronomicrosphaera hydrolytica TaxID=3242702 RepID=A0ABV4U8G1_9BACT
MADASPPPWLPFGRGSALSPLDAAAALVRERGSELLPIYVLAVIPLTAAAWVAIDAVTAEDRSALPLAAGLLAGSLLWRWAWLSVLQQRVQVSLRGRLPTSLRRRWAGVLGIRLVAATLMTWGLFLFMLPVVGLLLGSFITPALLEGDQRTLPTAGQLLRWLGGAVGRVSRVLTAVVVMGLVLLVGVMVLQWFVVMLVLPSLLGIETTDLALTMESPVWWMGSVFAVWLMMDFFWTIAAVLVYYDVQAKRLGSDLHWRLVRLQEGDASS